MSDFVRIGSKEELPPPGQAREFPCGTRTICVANVEGKFEAVDNVCPHRGGPLGLGIVEGNKIVCPWHGWEFELATGNNPFTPNLGVAKYELKIEGDEVFARLRSKAV